MAIRSRNGADGEETRGLVDTYTIKLRGYASGSFLLLTTVLTSQMIYHCGGEPVRAMHC